MTRLLLHRQWCTAQLPVMTVMIINLIMMTLTVEGVALKTEERKSRMKRSESSEAEWSVWFNSDRPWDGEGDFETTDNIMKTQHICSWDKEVVSAQCRVSGTNDTFDSSTTAFLEDRLLQACSSHGLICLNSQQISGRCHDYQVRFLCQDPQTDGGGDSLFPNLDFRIYILLAAVPLLVIVARLLWTCCCSARLKRQRQLRQQQRQRQRGSLSSGTLSSSSSQASFDSTLAHPPPPYTELFGEGQPAVFSISSGRECAGCEKCLHSPVFVEGIAVSTTIASHPPPQQDQEEEGIRFDASPPSPPASPDDVFLAGSPSSHTVNGNSARPVLRPSLPSSASLQGAAAPPPVPTALPPSPPSVPIPSSSSPPDSTQTRCTCSCHRLTSAQVNLGFQWDSSDPVSISAPPAPLLPGMHKPVFSFPRIDSITSFTSYTSLPDYEEALEILKKNGLFLDEEKV